MIRQSKYRQMKYDELVNLCRDKDLIIKDLKDKLEQIRHITNYRYRKDS